MIRIILIIAYIVAFGGAAVIFLFHGKKKGWRGGASVMAAAVLSLAVTCLLASVIASALAGIEPITRLVEDAAESASEIGIESSLLADMMTDIVRRVLEIPLSVMLYIPLFAIFLVLAKVVIKLIKPKTDEIDKNSRIIGAALGAAAPVLVAVLTLFVSKVNLFNESDTVDRIMELTSQPEEIVSVIMSDPESYTRILFETTLTGTDENQRLELVSKSVNSVFSSAGDELLAECLGFEGYSSRSEFETDIKALIELYGAFSDTGATGDFLHRVFAVADRDKMADNLYTLSFKDGIIRYVISYAVQDLTGSESFVCSKEIRFQGTSKDLAQVVTLAEKYDKGELSQIDLFTQLKTSPLFPEELYRELYESLYEEFYEDVREAFREEYYDDIYDKLNEALDEELSPERYEELYEEYYEEFYDTLYEELYDELDDILNNGLSEERYEELYDELYDELYGKLFD